jgi:hypothetical protein
MTPPDPRSSAVDDRRRNTRRTSDVGLRVVIDADAIGGHAENISQAGVFFFSRDALRVTVHMEQDGETRSYTGRIVRVERLGDESTGFAIEFDRL